MAPWHERSSTSGGRGEIPGNTMPASLSTAAMPSDRAQPPMQVRVNGAPIDADAIDAETQYHPAESLQQARRQATTALLIRQVLVQEAKRLGIEAQPQPGESLEEAQLRVLLAQEVSLPAADEVAARNYYNNHRDRFRSSPLYQASHIFIAAAPDDPAARAAAKDLASRILTDVRAAPERFAELAREYSACPSRKDDGNLGQFGRGQTVKEFESYLDRMEPGTLSTAPLETRYGFHIVHLERRIEGKQLPYEVVEDRIEGYLKDHVQRQAVSQYIQLLMEAADIQGIDVGEKGPGRAK